MDFKEQIKLICELSNKIHKKTKDMDLLLVPFDESGNIAEYHSCEELKNHLESGKPMRLILANANDYSVCN